MRVDGRGRNGGRRDPLRIGAALELLQACALVHDDVMDESPVRRGAPAVHADFARMHRAGRLRGSAASWSANAAVLAGDLALAWADDLFTETALSSPYGERLHREWQAMRVEMAAGQYLDVRAQATGSSDPAQARHIATLKSALYTVERPLALGASLAGADARTMEALRSAGQCVGLAFQLRDDLLGAFGDPDVTGKPTGEDLRARKLTYLLAVAVGRATESGDTDALAVLGAEGAPPGERRSPACGPLWSERGPGPPWRRRSPVSRHPVCVTSPPPEPMREPGGSSPRSWPGPWAPNPP